MSNPKISVVTVCRNRSNHLISCCNVLSLLPHHYEHVVLDIGSTPAVNLVDLPSDSRIKLLRAEYDGPWWASHSYNCAMAQACGDVFVHCDADCLLTDEFFDDLRSKIAFVDFSASRMSLVDWRMTDDSSYPSMGLFWVKASAYWSVGGMNPYIQGWGFEEVDLLSRLFLAGFHCTRQSVCSVSSILHDDFLRIDTAPQGLFQILQKRTGKAVKSVSHHKNKLVSLLMIQKNICDYPSSDAYKLAFERRASLPLVRPISLLNSHQLRSMQRMLFRLWLCKSLSFLQLGRFLAVPLARLIPGSSLAQFLDHMGIFANQSLLVDSGESASLKTY